MSAKATETSKGPSAPTTPVHGTPFVDGALTVVKGAACVAFGIPTARTTLRVKRTNEVKGTILLRACVAVDLGQARDEMQALIDAKIAEECPFESYNVDREAAEGLYADAMYDSYPVPETETELRVQILRDFNINCNSFPVVKHTGLLGQVSVDDVKVVKDIELLISFTVHPTPEAKSLPESMLVAPVKQVGTDILQLPILKQCLPPSGVEKALSADLDAEVTPWTVGGGDKGIDYDKLIRQFGCSHVSPELIARMEKVTGQRAPYMLRRGLFFSHRDLDLLLDAIELGREFYLYTGRGPSSESLHIGHLVPMMFTAELQRIFKVKVVIELTDDEKFLFKDNLTLKEAYRLGYENTRDIMACGFDLENTFIFSDVDYMQYLYPVALSIQKKVTANQAKGIFGFTDSDNIGKMAFAAVQASPSFAICFPGFFKDPANTRCLIPQAIDQDPYFRMTRDVAPRLGLRKPALLHSKFIPALQGFKTKMSGSTENTCVYVTDDPKTIANKVNNFAFSGGGATLAEHRANGANLAVDVPYHYLTFLHPDDALVDDIGKKYSKGEMLTGEVKKILIDHLVLITQKHQQARAQITTEMVTRVMDPKRHQVHRMTTILS